MQENKMFQRNIFVVPRKICKVVKFLKKVYADKFLIENRQSRNPKNAKNPENPENPRKSPKSPKKVQKRGQKTGGKLVPLFARALGYRCAQLRATPPNYLLLKNPVFGVTGAASRTPPLPTPKPNKGIRDPLNGQQHRR